MVRSGLSFGIRDGNVEVDGQVTYLPIYMIGCLDGA